MKITKIKTFKFNINASRLVPDPINREARSSPFKTWLFLKIETDTELYGWGEASGEWLSPLVEFTLHEWAELLVGRDPLNVASICDDISDRLPWKGGPVFGSAIAAINMALYDITGKAWKAPLYQLLGGKRRDRIKIYSDGINFVTEDRAVTEAREAIQAGARGLKGNPLESRADPLDHRALEHSTRIMAAVRKEVGPDIELMLDAHGSPNPVLSIAFAHMVAPYHPLFLEEPCKVGSVVALKEVSTKSPVPIASGEKLFSFQEFKTLIDGRACAILQPDVSHSYGITNYLFIAHLANEAQMLMAPHNAGGPVYFAALLHADAAISNFLIQEVSGTWLTRFGDYVDHDFVVREGYVELNERPGLGIDVKEHYIAKLPYNERMPYRQYRHYDGSWKGW